MKFTREQVISGLKNGTIALEHRQGNAESYPMLASLCTEAFTRDRAPSGTAKYYYKGATDGYWAADSSIGGKGFTVLKAWEIEFVTNTSNYEIY